MGTNFSANGTDLIGFYDQSTLATAWTTYTTNFKCATLGGNDLATYLQPLYDNPFFVETLLTTPGSNSGFRQLTYALTQNDLSLGFARKNSLYATSSTYLITTAQITQTGGVSKRTNATPSPTAAALYHSSSTPAPPYTYQWTLIPQYAGVAFAINPNTVIETPTTAYTRFNQAIGSGYTNQLAQCTITDALGRIGYTKVVQINFLTN